MVSTAMVCPEQHHSTLYFEDGNVVLSALDKDGQRCYFRVHQSVLCRYSPIFEEMFQIPPLRGEGPEHAIVEVYDGVLHIQMPDSADELGSLIGVLYDPLYVISIPCQVSCLSVDHHEEEMLISVSAQILRFSSVGR